MAAMASGIAEPVTWWSAIPTRANKSPSSAAASSANTARTTGSDLRSSCAEFQDDARWHYSLALPLGIGLRYLGPLLHDLYRSVRGDARHLAVAPVHSIGAQSNFEQAYSSWAQLSLLEVFKGPR